MSSHQVLPFNVVELSSLRVVTVASIPLRAVRVHRFHVSTKRDPDPIWEPTDGDWEALSVVYDHIEERYGSVFAEKDLNERARNALSWHPPVEQDEALDRLRAMVTPFPNPHPWIALKRVSLVNVVENDDAGYDAAGFSSLVFEQITVGNVLVNNGGPIAAYMMVGEPLTVPDVQPGMALSVVLRDDSDVSYQVRMMAMCERIR